jgi:hypothetical protein
MYSIYDILRQTTMSYSRKHCDGTSMKHTLAIAQVGNLARAHKTLTAIVGNALERLLKVNVYQPVQ